jgi:hypothetical protein
MRIQYLLSGLGLAVILTGCSKTPGVKYLLTADRLAWQPYQGGQVLHFANSSTGATRTYAVTKVSDYMEKERLGINWVPLLGSREPDEYQNVAVTIQRTDSVGYSFTAVEFTQNNDPGSPAGIFFMAAGWESLGTVRLPADELNQGLPFDTTQYKGVRLLPALTLGTLVYTNVLEVKSQYTGTISPGLPTIKRIYYTKNKGVLAFDDQATGRWWLVP